MRSQKNLFVHRGLRLGLVLLFPLSLAGNSSFTYKKWQRSY